MMRFLREYATRTHRLHRLRACPYDTFVGLKYKIVTNSDYYV